MTLPTEAVATPGSGLVFVNYYESSVSDPYRSAILTAEHTLQSAFTNPLTISIDFSLGREAPGTIASNSFGSVGVSYAALTAALRANATTSDDFLTVNGLPATDPSHGVGFSIPIAEAVALGLAPETNTQDVSVSLSSSEPWTFGQDAVGALEHEITEGAFGRIGSLGVQDVQWAPMDLFRFTAAGRRDYTGGQDGIPTFFGLDSAHVTPLQFHSAVSPAGVKDGFDLADWETTTNDAFGSGGAGIPASMSPTDLRVLDVLGWNSTPYTPAPDDYANSLGDTAAPMGQLGAGRLVAAALQSAGDRDWFAMSLQAGHTYTISEIGQANGGGTLADPFLRLHDSGGVLLASNDDIVSGDNPDSQIVFTPTTSGTYYAEAGGFVDGYAGSYDIALSLGAPGAAATAGNDVILAPPGGGAVNGLAGDDTITGLTGSNTLFGGDGNDSIVGGAGFDVINGNKGDDTIVGNSLVGDWLSGGQGNDLIIAHGPHDIVNGNLGNDTLIGAAGDTLRGGQGDDSIVAGAGAEWISGDLGDDTIQAGSGPDTIFVFAGAGHDQVFDFSAANGDRVEVATGVTYSLSQVGADTIVTLSSGDQVLLHDVQLSTLPGGWIFAG